MKRLFDLPIVLSSRWIFNCYVVPDAGEGALVVDAGLACTAQDAVRALSLNDDDAESMVNVVSTHGHSDHVGGIPTFVDGWVRDGQTAKVFLPERCRSYLAGEKPRSPGPREVAKILPVFAEQPFDWTALRDVIDTSRSGYGRNPHMTLPFTPDDFLADGDHVTKQWEVLSAPGHTDDSTCLYHRESATLISGDAILTHQGRAWFNPEVVDRQAARQTEERLRELDVRHLLPGHGLPLEGLNLTRDARAFDRPASGGVLATMARAIGRWG